MKVKIEVLSEEQVELQVELTPEQLKHVVDMLFDGVAMMRMHARLLHNGQRECEDLKWRREFAEAVDMQLVKLEWDKEKSGV